MDNGEISFLGIRICPSRAGGRAQFGISRTPVFLCIEDNDCTKKGHFKEEKGI